MDQTDSYLLPVKITIRAQAVAAAILGLTAVGLCLVAIGRLAGWKLQLGDLGTWVGGIGSAAAAFAAFVTLRQLLKTRREERQERRARALLRAGRIEVRIEPVRTTVGPHYPLGWTVSVANTSDRPIYGVKVGPALTAARPDTDPAVVTMRHPLVADLHPSEFLAAGTTLTWEYVSDETIVNNTYPFAPVTFVDEEGNQFRSVPADLSPSGKTVSRWVHADALSPSGHWERQTDRITPSTLLVHEAGQFPRSVYK